MEDLQFEQFDNVGIIKLNRPESLNAFSQEMIKLWISALEEIRDNDDIHVGILTGNGKAFCAGGDIKAMKKGNGFMANTKEENNDLASLPLHVKNSLWKMIQRIPLIMEQIDKPMIAAINGPAIGAGLDMALMCDIRYSSERAKVGEGYVKAGIVPGDGGGYFLPRIVGLDKALEMFWTGDILNADEAKEIGLVSYVIEHDKLMDTVISFAQKLASGPQQSMRMTKRIVYQSQTMNLTQSLDMASSMMAISVHHPEHQESLNKQTKK